MNPQELVKNQMEFLEESTKETFKTVHVPITEEDAESLAEDTARQEYADDNPTLPEDDEDKEFNEDLQNEKE